MSKTLSAAVHTAIVDSTGPSRAITTLVYCIVVLAAGCGQQPSSYNYGTNYNYGGDGEYAEVEMSEARGVTGPKFQAISDSNTDQPYDPAGFRFTRNDGTAVTLDELAPGKPLLLVVTRGAEENLCPACTAQTARLYDAYEDFAAAGAEVVVAYPKRIEPTGGVTFDQFLQQVNNLLSREKTQPPPFPIVFDADLETVKALGIEADLAKPSTFLFDADRSLLFAYIGESVVDRPDIESLLAIVRRSVGAAPAATTQSQLADPNAAADSKTNG